MQCCLAAAAAAAAEFAKIFVNAFTFPSSSIVCRSPRVASVFDMDGGSQSTH